MKKDYTLYYGDTAYDVEYEPRDGIISVTVGGTEIDIDGLYVPDGERFITLKAYLEAQADDMHCAETGDCYVSEYATEAPIVI